MRQLVLYGLLLAVLLPSISPWGTIAYYQLNKEYIVKNLCVNRNRPELHCDGKCYLAKKLKAQQNRQEKETSDRLQKLPYLLLFCQELPSLFVVATVELLQSPRYVYILSVYLSPITDFLNPPQ